MNQKEYELIAGVFYREMIQLSTTAQADFWRDMVSAMANQLEITYSNFDRDKFLKACGAK